MGAQFKGLEDETDARRAAPPMELIEQSRPLFDEFDPSEQGGLGITPDGQVFEIRHPYWATNGSTDIAARTQLLPIRTVNGEQEAASLEWLGPPFDPANPSLGSESEFATMHGAKFHKISPDGVTAVYPDGSAEPLRNVGWDPEAVQTMAETKSEPAFGYTAHRRSVIESTFATELELDRHDLTHAGLALYPEDYRYEDTWSAPYARKVLDRLHNAREFGVMSDQLHVQIFDPDAAQYALNKYQAVQAVIGLITSAAPIRDSSFDTTIGEHYRIGASQQEKDAAAQATGDYPDPHLDEHDYLRHFANEVPYDWRELGRILGSESSGAFSEPAPVNLLTVLQQADRGLRDGSLISSGRVFGMHNDRLRLDLGTIEIMNMGPSGGNLYKKLAAQELVAKYLVALQLEYMQMNPAERATEQEGFQAATDVGHINNILVALEGKDPNMRLHDQRLRPKTPRRILREMIAFTNRYSPVAVLSETERELLATLSCKKPTFTTVEGTFAAYFQQNSQMSATDALRHAHQLRPNVPPNQILELFAKYRRMHVYHIHDTFISERGEAA